MSLLSQPYPVSSKESNVKLSVGIAAFVGLFLAIFLPFNIGEVPVSIRYKCIAGYATLSLLVCLFNTVALPFFLPKVFDEKKWTTGRQIITVAYNFIAVGTANLLLSFYYGFVDLSFSSFINYQLITLAVGIFPISIYLLLKQNYTLKLNMKAAMEISRQLERPSDLPKEVLLTFISDNEKDRLLVAAKDVLYLESADNYVEIVYWKDEKLEKALLRGTLNRMEETLKTQEDFYRCHRTYIVNLKKIQGISGNSQGLRISFAATDKQVPVARSQYQVFREKLSR
jgi:hypothetical protein